MLVLDQAVTRLSVLAVEVVLTTKVVLVSKVVLASVRVFTLKWC